MLLKVNREKSHVAYISSPQTKFLGYGFYYSRTKREVRLTIHEKSKQKLKDTIRKLLSRSPKTSIESVKQLLAPTLVENLEKGKNKNQGPGETGGGP